MTEKNNSKYSLTAPVVMTFPNLFEARAVGKKGTATGKPKFSGSYLLVRDSLDHKTAKDICIGLAKAKWPGRSLKELKFPFTSGDAKADERAKLGKADSEYTRGHSILVARSTYEPALSEYVNGRAVDLTGPARAAAKAKFYPGVKVLAAFTFATYEGVGANPDGVCAYLDAVCTLNEGTRLAGGAPSASETFKGYVGHATQEDPTVGAEDELVD